MNDDRIEAACEVIRWFSEQTRALPDGEGLEMSVRMALVDNFLMEYRHHTLVSDREPYDALVSALRGELKLTQMQKDLWTTLRPSGSPSSSE